MNKLPALLLALAACEDPLLCPTPEQCTPPPDDEVEVLTVTPNLDLLIVVDDSPTMIEKQDSFRAAFPALLTKLAAIEGGLPNLHLAVISPDMGTSAIGDASPGPGIGQPGNGGCQSAGKAGAFQLGTAALDDGETFVRLSRDGSQNFEGDLATVFGNMAALGATGCGFEQPLAAVRAAIANDDNAGFFRPGANLAVLVITDEDDCSAEHTSLFGPESTALGPLASFRCFRFGVECDQDTGTPGTKTNCHPAGSAQVANPDLFADAILATKTDPKRVMFGGLVGTPGSIEVEMRTTNGSPEQPTVVAACGYTSTESGLEITADPAVRLTALADEFAGVSKLESICSEDLAPAASSLGDSLASLMTNHCVPAEFAEAECIVEDHRDADPDYAATIARCDASQGVGANCFRFVADAACASGQRLTIARPIPPAGDEWSTLRCRR